MNNYEVDSNIKLILDLKVNKGVFPLTVDSAVIAHSPNGETTYLDSVVDYLYQLIANKLRLYTELDGAYTRGKAYPATMGVQNANNINALLSTVNNYASILSALQKQVNNMDPTDDITSINNTIQRLWSILTNLSEASEYSYQEIKFSDSLTLPPSDLDNTTYWKNQPMDNPLHLWLGVRTIAIKRGEDGKPIITKGAAMVVSLQGPKGDKGDRGDRGASGSSGSIGAPGKSYRPVLMYKWTDSRVTVPTAPTDPLNLGWTESPGNALDENKYLWMTLNYIDMSDSTYINSTWSTPVCLSGEDGVGSDGAGIEFIFFRTNNIDANPTVNDLNAYKDGTAIQQADFQTDNFPFIGANGTNIVSGNLWTDNPQGIEYTNKYEWASFRLSNRGEWGSFCVPFRWSMWGEDGIDGDGVEFIYYRCNEPNKWSEYSIYDDATDPRNWSNDSNYQDSEYIREGSGWTDDPQGVTESNMYEYVSSRKKLAYANNPHDKRWKEYSQPVLWAKFGQKGLDGAAAEQGLSGPVVRFRGKYDSNTTYINSSLDTALSPTDIRYIDVVFVTNSNNLALYYMVKPLLGGTQETSANPTNSAYWEQATEYSFIAAEALYARNAHIDNLSGYEFVVLDNPTTNNIVAGMTGGTVEDSVVASNYTSNPVRIWAGSSASDNINLLSDNIPFKVFQDGKLKATNAEIKGDLSVDSLLLTGNRGSYYYNLSTINLPKVDSSNHKVIFIITAGTGTVVNANIGDVLFAFSNNTMQTTNSTTLSTYKIYLAISINNGLSSGWLLLNLNALELSDIQQRYFAQNIVQGPMSTWSITSTDAHNNNITLFLAEDLGNICNFTTVNMSSYLGVANHTFTLGGNIKFKVGNSTIATLELKDIPYDSLGSNANGTITMEDIINTYTGHLSYLSLDGEGSITILNSNLDTDGINITIQNQWNLDSATQINVIPSISLTESFNYIVTANSSNPVTTTTVGSNGFVIDKGSIVATDITEGASINIKDCIAYKDITETGATNELYEVTNFGASNVTIGNTILPPNNKIIVIANSNAHIDFSDVDAIDANDIYDIDNPALLGEPFNP